MFWWRCALLTFLGVVLGLPFVLPILECSAVIGTFEVQQELSRLTSLATTTTILIVAVITVSLPVGVVSGLLLFRTDVPGRSLFRLITGLILFVPLPVFTSAWQAALGYDGWLLSLWFPRQGQPWSAGLFPAIWVHSLAAIPWTTLIVGVTSRWVEPELEEDALLVCPAPSVLRRVTIPRCFVGILCAAIWTTIQVAGCIVVTDMFQVRSFAEEVYLVLNQASTDAVSLAVLVSLPAMFILLGILLILRIGAHRLIPSPRSATRPPFRFSLVKWRWPCFGGLLLLYAFVLLLPLISLLHQIGLEGTPSQWSWESVLRQFQKAIRVSGSEIVFSFLCAWVVGICCSFGALVTCSLTTQTKYIQHLLFGFFAAIAVMPGPILGLGLKSSILLVISTVPMPLIKKAFYFGPSWIPVGWAYFLRWFPIGFAIVWLSFRSIPSALNERAALDGLTTWGRLWHLHFPLARKAVLVATIVVAALSLGEVSTSKLASTPGVQTFSMVVFDRMHYGVTQEVAAVCLVQLSCVGVLGVVFLGLGFLARNHFWTSNR